MMSRRESNNGRRVCVVTGTRADYGLLYWLLHDLKVDARAELQIIATGMHLSPEFGLTLREIEADGFSVDAKVEMLLSADTPTAIAKSIGLGVIGFADAFERLNPDIIVVLGDRFEIFAAAQAAMVARLPVAHLHGGEATEGLIDEAIRHSLTKMSHLHFVAADVYRDRVIQLGETPDRVFQVGAMALDHLRRGNILSRGELARNLEFDLTGPVFLVTYHPVTLDGRSPSVPMNELLSALDAFSDVRIVITKANADTAGRILNEMIDAYAASRPDRVLAVTSLGHRRYLSLMQEADVLIGNSSSGILEAPSAGVPTVNIGPRQDGRLRAPSVIDCNEERGAITDAVHQAISAQFRGIAARRESPFGDGTAAAKVKEELLTRELTGIVRKRFHNLTVPVE